MTSYADILVLEDDLSLRRDLVDFLELNGLRVDSAEDSNSFFNAYNTYRPHLLVVDLILPDGNGVDVIRRVREEGYNGKILILTALNSDEQQIEGYEVGADAYLDKHSSLKLITTCVKRLLAMSGSSNEEHGIQQALWTLDTVSRRLILEDGDRVKLTHKEFQVLKRLMAEQGQPLSRTLLSENKEELAASAERRIDAIISRLRRKVSEQTGQSLPVEQVYGIGYTFSGRSEVLSR